MENNEDIIGKNLFLLILTDHDFYPIGVSKNKQLHYVNSKQRHCVLKPKRSLVNLISMRLIKSCFHSTIFSYYKFYLTHRDVKSV